MATYPAGLYTYTNRTGTQTLLAGTHSTLHNADAAEIIAIETELGTNPKGAYPTVRDRLEGITALVGTTHTQNTDVGSSSATFYLNGSSGAKIKEIGGAYAVRNNADTLYVDFTCDDLTCSTINGISSATLTSLVTNNHTHANKGLLDTYTQTEVNLASAVALKHTQNTDTGSTSETFQLNNGNVTSAKVKVDDLSPTIVDIRNAADDAFADIRADNFRGDLQANNADVARPTIRFNDGGTETWQFSNDGTNFYDLQAPALVLAGNPGTVQWNGGANLSADNTFYYNDTTDTLYVANITISGVLTGSTVVGGTTSDTFEINTDGNGLTLDTAGLTGDVTILATDLVGVMGTGIQDLTDPGADRIMFWDESSNFVTWLTVSTGLDITGTTLTNSDTGSGAVTAHNIAFDHTKLHDILTISDTASVDLGLTGQLLSATVLPAGVDHNSLNNYDANKHIDHTAVSISTGTGLTGGGDISATRTLSLSHLGIQSLTDPGADRLMLWDDTDNLVQWVTVGTGLTYTHATHTLSATGTVTDLDSAYNGGNTIDVDTNPVTLTVSDTDNNRVLDLVQNDTTNNPDALLITNAGTGAALKISGAGSTVYIQEQAAASADVAGYGQLWVKTATPNELWFTDDTGVDVQLGGGGATLTRATFTNANLTAGVLTITHSAALSAPYTVMVTVFDNNYQQIIPDSITGATNTVAIVLSSYVTAGGGSIAGTWGYGFIA